LNIGDDSVMAVLCQTYFARVRPCCAGF